MAGLSANAYKISLIEKLLSDLPICNESSQDYEAGWEDGQEALKKEILKITKGEQHG